MNITDLNKKKTDKFNKHHYLNDLIELKAVAVVLSTPRLLPLILWHYHIKSPFLKANSYFTNSDVIKLK